MVLITEMLDPVYQRAWSRAFTGRDARMCSVRSPMVRALDGAAAPSSSAGTTLITGLPSRPAT